MSDLEKMNVDDRNEKIWIERAAGASERTVKAISMNSKYGKSE
jgi:hypothetical protein